MSSTRENESIKCRAESASCNRLICEDVLAVDVDNGTGGSTAVEEMAE